MRKIIIAAIVIVLIAVIAGGILGYTYLQSQNQPAPSNPAQTTNEIENIRDQAMTYLAANHTQTLPLMPTGHWSGGRVDTGLLGAENYLFTTSEWDVSINYPVVLNPSYNIVCNYTSANLTWVGTYQGGVLTETSCAVGQDTSLDQAGMRDLTLMYLQAYHNETSTYMHDMSWTGGRMDMGMMVGSDKYNYMGNGWNVTIQNPVVPFPPYTVTAVYTQSNMHSAMMTWVGMIHNGTITQTSYEYNP
jgi:hypothetical protein